MLATRVIVIATVRTALALSSAYAGWTIAQRADAFVGALDAVFRESIGYVERSMIIAGLAGSLVLAAGLLVTPSSRARLGASAMILLLVMAQGGAIISIVRFGIALPCDCLPGARTDVTLGHEALSSIPALGAVGCCCIYALLYTRKDVGIAKDT